MAEFKSWQSYRQFARDVKSNFRYLRSEYSEDFLQTVLATSGIIAAIFGAIVFATRGKPSQTDSLPQPQPEPIATPTPTPSPPPSPSPEPQMIRVEPTTLTIDVP